MHNNKLKKRNAAGLPVNTIILAILALIVLIVVITIFTRTSGNTIDVMEDCESRGGVCKDKGHCDYVQIPKICKEEDKICCVPIESD